MKNRKEYDSIGGINVPVDNYWGASTQRSNKYFDIFRDQFLGGLEHIGVRKVLTGKNINIGKVSSELVNNLLSGVSK